MIKCNVFEFEIYVFCSINRIYMYMYSIINWLIITIFIMYTGNTNIGEDFI